MAITKVDLANVVTGVLPVANGGTGTSTGVAPGGSNTQVQYNSSGAFAGSSSFVFDGTNVGIGTSSPSGKLNVVQNGTPIIGQFDRTDSGTGLVVAADSSGPYFRPTTSTAIRWNNYSNTTEFMRIASSGNVGIGATSPLANLHVKNAAYGEFGAGYATGCNFLVSTGDGGGNNVYARIIGGIYTQVNSANLDLFAAGNDFGYQIGWRFTSLAAGSGAGGARNLIFNQMSTDGSGNPVATEKMRLDGSGNLMVNSTSPVNSSKTSITDSSGNSQLSLAYSSGVYTSLYVGNNGTLYIQPNGTTSAIFDNSNNFKFNSGYGSVATAYGCRAWVNFNGTGTIAIRSSGNVSSLTDLGTGNYAVNFSSAMPDTNYTCASFAASGTLSNSFYLSNSWIKDSGSAYVWTGWSGSAFDCSYVGVQIVR